MPSTLTHVTPTELPLSRDRCALEIVVSYGESTLDVRHLVGQKSFVIGEGKAADLTVSSDDLPASEFPLVRPIDGQFVLTFIGDQRGEIEHEGVFRPLQWLRSSNDVRPDDQFAGCYRYALPLDGRATLRFGGLTIAMRYVSPPDRVEEQRGHSELRYSTVLLTLSSILAIAIAIGLIASFKPELAEIKFDSERVARFFGAKAPTQARQVDHLVLDTSPIAVGITPVVAAERIAEQAKDLSECTRMLPRGSGFRATFSEKNVDVEVLSRTQGTDGLDCVRDVLTRVQFPASATRVIYTLGVTR